MPFPGYGRTWPTPLYRETMRRGLLRVVSLPASAMQSNGGRVIGVVDASTTRPLAIAFHPGGTEPEAGAYQPETLGEIKRQTAMDTPTLLNFRGKTRVISPWDEQKLWDGTRFRRTGLRAPQVAPVVQTDFYAANIRYVGTEADGPDPALGIDPATKVLTLWLDFTNGTKDPAKPAGIDLTTTATFGALQSLVDGLANWQMNLAEIPTTTPIIVTGDIQLAAVVADSQAGRAVTLSSGAALIGALSVTALSGAEVPTKGLDRLTATTVAEEPAGSIGDYINLKFTFAAARPTGTLFRAVPAQKAIIKATATSTRIRLRLDARDNKAFDSMVDAPWLSLVFDATATFTGSSAQRITIPVVGSGAGKTWVACEMAIPSTLDSGADRAADFTVGSVGLLLNTVEAEETYYRKDGFVTETFNQPFNTQWNTSHVRAVSGEGDPFFSWEPEVPASMWAKYMGSQPAGYSGAPLGNRSAKWDTRIDFFEIQPEEFEGATELLNGSNWGASYWNSYTQAGYDPYHPDIYNPGLYGTGTHKHFATRDWKVYVAGPDNGGADKIDAVWCKYLGYFPAGTERPAFSSAGSGEGIFGLSHAGGWFVYQVSYDEIEGGVAVPRQEQFLEWGFWGGYGYNPATGMRVYTYRLHWYFDLTMDVVNVIGFHSTWTWQKPVLLPDAFYLKVDAVQVYGSSQEADLSNEDQYLLAFSWFDPTTLRESAPSPYSDPIWSPVESYNLEIDLAGVKADLPAGLENSPPDETASEVRVYIHRAQWGADLLTGFPLMRRVATLPVPPIQGGTSNDKRRLVKVVRASSEALLLLEDGPAYYNQVPPAARLALADGDRIIYGGIPEYATGRVTTTAGSNLITRRLAYLVDPGTGVLTTTYFDAAPEDNTPAGYIYRPDTANQADWGPWMEGRQIAIGNDTDRYLVIKVLQDDSGVYSSLYVGRGENLDGYPTTQADASYRLTGDPLGVYFSGKSAQQGVQDEACSVLNRFEADMPGDEIVGLGHAGNYLVIVGRRHVVYYLQDHSALDGSGAVFSRPRSAPGAPGCVAGRTMVSLPGNQTMWLSPEGQLVLASSDGAQVHPISELFRGWASSQYRVDARALRHAHAVYLRDRAWYVLFLVDPAAAQAPDGGFGQWPGSPLDNTGYSERPDGSARDTSTTLTQDFGRVLVFDLNHKVLYPGWGFPFTCTYDNAGAWAGLGDLPSAIYGAGTDGRISRIFAENLYGLGAPCPRLSWGLAAAPFADPWTVLTTNETDLLPSGMLVGLPVTVRLASGVEYARSIEANTTSTITVDEALPDVDLTGARVLIAPMACALLFREIRRNYPGTLLSAGIRYENRQSGEQDFEWETYRGNDDDGANLSAPAQVRAFSTADVKAGRGRVRFRGLSAQAAAYALAFEPVGGGALSVGAVDVEEFVDVADIPATE